MCPPYQVLPDFFFKPGIVCWLLVFPAGVWGALRQGEEVGSAEWLREAAGAGQGALAAFLLLPGTGWTLPLRASVLLSAVWNAPLLPSPCPASVPLHGEPCPVVPGNPRALLLPLGALLCSESHHRLK